MEIFISMLVFAVSSLFIGKMILKTESFNDNTVLDIVPLKTETDKEILKIMLGK